MQSALQADEPIVRNVSFYFIYLSVNKLIYKNKLTNKKISSLIKLFQSKIKISSLIKNKLINKVILK